MAKEVTYTTICLRASKRLVMNLRVLIVTCASAMIAVGGSRGLQKEIVELSRKKSFVDCDEAVGDAGDFWVRGLACETLG